MASAKRRSAPEKPLSCTQSTPADGPKSSNPVTASPRACQSTIRLAAKSPHTAAARRGPPDTGASNRSRRVRRMWLTWLSIRWPPGQSSGKLAGFMTTVAAAHVPTIPREAAEGPRATRLLDRVDALAIVALIVVGMVPRLVWRSGWGLGDDVLYRHFVNTILTNHVVPADNTTYRLT